MRRISWLKLASIVSLLFAIGHLAGFWRPAPDDREQQIAQQAMMVHRFDLVGTARTYWEIYLGFGLMNGIVYVMQAIIFWLLSNLQRRDAEAARPLMLTLLVANAAIVALLMRHLFIVPQVLQALILLLLVLALWFGDRTSEPKI